MLDRRPEGRAYIVGDEYTIADMAFYRWTRLWKGQQQDLDQFPNIKRWIETVAQRRATVRAYAKSEPFSNRPVVTEEARKVLFGQTAASVKA